MMSDWLGPIAVACSAPKLVVVSAAEEAIRVAGHVK
jgi:hypothetical protein